MIEWWVSVYRLTTQPLVWYDGSISGAPTARGIRPSMLNLLTKPRSWFTVSTSAISIFVTAHLCYNHGSVYAASSAAI